MGQLDRAAMREAFVQGVVGPFPKHLRPLQNASGEKSRNRAENNLLEKSGMHLDPFEARAMPLWN